MINVRAGTSELYHVGIIEQLLIADQTSIVSKQGLRILTKLDMTGKEPLVTRIVPLTEVRDQLIEQIQ